jgi:hypothetical protein
VLAARAVASHHVEHERAFAGLRYRAGVEDVIDWILRKTIAVCLYVAGKAYAAQKDPIWISTDGRATPISKMSDCHLINAICVVDRQPERDLSRSYPFLLAEAQRRSARDWIFKREYYKRRPFS